MDTTTIVGIVIAVILALIVLGVLVWAARRRGDARRHQRAEELRERLRREDTEVRHHESIASETEARARAARAEADAKSAEAERLQNAAESHRHDVGAAREDLEKRKAHLDSMDDSMDPHASDPHTSRDGRR